MIYNSFLFSSQRELHSVPSIDYMNYELFRPNWSYQGQIYQNVSQVFKWKFVTIPFVLFYQFFFYMIQPIKFVFLKSLSLSQKLETSYSFKIIFILVRQVISGGVIGKIYCLISWSPICTHLILVSASMKMASNSATVIYNSMRVDTPGGLLI